MNYLSKADKEKLKGVCLLRLDFNTDDDWRMQVSISTLNFLKGVARKIVIMGHKGRPKGVDPELSLEHVAPKISSLLGQSVLFIEDTDASSIKGKIDAAPDGSILLMENLRFFAGEEGNDESFAKDLASFGEYYVNDAFAVCHRANASVVAITKLMPSYAGLVLEAEYHNLKKIVDAPESPFVLILGGGKADEKLEVAKFLYDKVDSILLGGVPANTLLSLKGVDVGDSVVAPNAQDFHSFIGMDKVILPEDWQMDDNRILDIGPKTIESFAPHIHQAKTVVWNGPLGYFEEGYANGTTSIAQEVAASHCYSLVGGGETVEFLKQTGLDKKMSFISTGGGAMLEFLSGKDLPGIKALE